MINRQTAGAEVILGQDLEPRDFWFGVEDFPIMSGSQAYAGAVDRWSGVSGYGGLVVLVSFAESIDLL